MNKLLLILASDLNQVSLIIIIVACLIGMFMFFYFVPIGLWITALFSGVRVGIGQLIGMRLRKVPPAIVVNNLIKSTKAGLKISISEIETHFLAKGNINLVIDALISADKANIDLDFKLAAAIDLAGRDVYKAVHDSVTPRVISSPPVAAVAKDGIQLIATSRITLRADIHRLVGGAGEETILARVGEGIVTTIGSAANHKDVLENPDRISKVVLSKGLDSGTAYSILSIDIADIDIGENVGAKLQTDQAEADLKVARARAEERRAMAVAAEQEFSAKAQEMRAKVISAEAEIPMAIAAAFREGKLGIMDYYRMKNVMADTQMRESFSKGDSEK